MSEITDLQKQLIKIDTQHADYRKWLMKNSKEYFEINKIESERYSKNAVVKGCYSNCYKIVMRNRKLKYIDGMVLALIPIDHAFLINEDNEIIDPTLAIRTDEREERYGIEYYGMEIPRMDLIKISLDWRNTVTPLSFLYWKLQIKRGLA